MKNPFGIQQDPCIEELRQRLEHIDESVEMLKKSTDNGRPLNGRRFMTDSELSQHLRFSRRTLQEYRVAGVLPYYLICGKLLYEESTIQEMLKKSYRAPFDDKQLI